MLETVALPVQARETRSATAILHGAPGGSIPSPGPGRVTAVERRLPAGTPLLRSYMADGGTVLYMDSTQVDLTPAERHADLEKIRTLLPDLAPLVAEYEAVLAGVA